MTAGLIAVALGAVALTPLGLIAAAAAALTCFAVVQLIGARWWWPVTLATLGALVLVLRWDAAQAELARSREFQLDAILNPQRRLGDWQARWDDWTIDTLAFAIPVGAFVGGLLSGARERHRTRWREHSVRRRRLRAVLTQRAAGRQSLRSLNRRGVILGMDEHGRTVRVTDEELAGHTLIVGATGSGKTTTLLVMIAAAIRLGHPVCVVDLKGDPRVLARVGEIAEGAGRSFSTWSIDGETTWNPLAYGNPTELKDKLIGLEEWTEPHYRRAAERYLQVIFSVLGYGDAPADLNRLVELMNPGGLNRELRRIPQPEAGRIADYIDGLTSDQISAVRGLANRLAVISESVAGPALVADGTGSAIDLRTTLTEGGVVVFSLNASTYGELAAHLGALVIQDLKTTAGFLLSGSHRLPAYVAVDEFSALGADHLLALLARARSAGIRVFLCTQELADVERAAEGFRDQVLGNTATKIAHRQDVPASAEMIAGVAGTRQAWHRTQQTHLLLGAGLVEETGVGTKRLVDEYLVHPNSLKTLRTGEAVLIRKHPKADLRVVRVLGPG